MADRLYISDVARVVGVPAATLRAWEQRYAVVTPQRSTSRYRTYSDVDVELLRHMRSLVDAGIAPSRAAMMTRAVRDTRSISPATSSVPGSVLGDHSSLARAGVLFDGAAVGRLLDEAFATAPAEVVIDQWLMPSLQHLGAAWQCGELDVSAEHFVSAAVMRKLAAMFDATSGTGPRVVVGLPETARHELPALAFAVCLRRRGLDVLYVGADLPVASWRHIVEVWAPSAAVVAAGYASEVPHARSAAVELARLGVRRVFVGGECAADVPNAIALPRRLSSAAQVVAAAIS